MITIPYAYVLIIILIMCLILISSISIFSQNEKTPNRTEMITLNFTFIKKNQLQRILNLGDFSSLNVELESVDKSY